MARQARRTNFNAHYNAVVRRAVQLQLLLTSTDDVIYVRSQVHINSRHTAQVMCSPEGVLASIPLECVGCAQCADSDPSGEVKGTWTLGGEGCALCSEDFRALNQAVFEPAEGDLKPARQEAEDAEDAEAAEAAEATEGTAEPPQCAPGRAGMNIMRVTRPSAIRRIETQELCRENVGCKRRRPGGV